MKGRHTQVHRTEFQTELCSISANPWPCTRNNRKTNEGSHAYLPATSKNEPWHRDGTKLSLEFCSVNLCVSSFHQSFVPLVKTSVWSSPIRMCSFVSCWSSLFLIFRLESLCFHSQASVSNYLSFPYCWFQICLYFPFRRFPSLVLRFFLDRIQNRCFPSRRMRYFFFNNPGWSPRPGGFITWLQFCPFHICWGSPVQSGAKRPT